MIATPLPQAIADHTDPAPIITLHPITAAILRFWRRRERVEEPGPDAPIASEGELPY